MTRNFAERGSVTCYFRFNDVPVAAWFEPNDGRMVRNKFGPPKQRHGIKPCKFGPTRQGLKIARICAGEVGKDNVVEYEETLHADGTITASGLVRNPMGF